MIMQVTDCTCGMLAVRTRRPLSSVWRSNTLTGCAPSASGLDAAGRPAPFGVPARRAACSRGELLPPLFGQLDRLALAVVVRDEDALRLGHDRLADAQHVLEVEALPPEAARVHRHLDLLAESDGGAEVD